MREIERKPLTPKQRETFLAHVADGVGTREALRRAGVTAGAASLTVTRAEAKAIIADDDELQHDYELARGRDLDAVEGRVYSIALDTSDRRSLDAAKFILERRHPGYVTRGAVDVNHSGEVRNPDVADALDRLNALIAAARVRATATAGAGRLALEP